VKCWGSNVSGNLGLGDLANRGAMPGEMGDALPAVDLGAGKTAVAVVAALGYHTCTILQGGAVKCWGFNDHGQLGLGDAMDRGDEPGEMGDTLLAVSLW
jgi:alpha-tubulin suppressor-like RCC1 family protein